MPPPMPNPAKRMTANPARPVGRYRPGKPVHEEESSEEEDEEEQEQVTPTQRRLQTTTARPRRGVPPVEDDDNDDDEEGFVTEDDEDGEPEVAKGAAITELSTKSTLVTRQSQLQPHTTPVVRGGSEDEAQSEATSEEEEEESDDEEASSSSEEEEPRKKFQRPTFIKKADRQSAQRNQENPASAPALSNGRPVNSSTSIIDLEAEEKNNRQLERVDLMIKDQLERDALARAERERAWDDDKGVPTEERVDDTDGLDPEAEHAAWKLRELKRLKRDREAMVAREKEIEETERRRNLTAEEREKEDRERRDLENSGSEAQTRTGGFMSRYHHKGAFFQDDGNEDENGGTAKLLKNRDLIGAKFQDEVTDKSTLPEYMRIRDMTKLGKKGRTRYTDLRGQDTGRFGEDIKRWKGAGYDNRRAADEGGGYRDVDERFLPDYERSRRAGGGGPSASGANASAVGERNHRDRPRQRDEDEHRRRGRRSRDSLSASRSRSPVYRHRSHSPTRPRSPLPVSSRRRRRSRSRSRSRSWSDSKSRSFDRDRERDKRRKIET